ncbi:hypothetical protein, partial [Streptococcus pneumoniae]|uniref:hypothetical protein n=1 Tax=Streptococcus pneumoniae TaxID=1313 RepID=UPI000845CDDF
FESHILPKVAALRSPQMCQTWLLMTEKMKYFCLFILKTKDAGLARNWVVPRINTFVPVM